MRAGSLMSVVGALLLGLILAPAALAAEIIIDNGEAGFAVTGEWPVSTVVSGYHGANYQFAPPGDVPGGTVVDNTDPGTSAVGTWTAGTGVAGFWGANYQSHPAGSGSESFTWPLAIPAAGSYKVFARWSASANRTNVARYTVNHAGGATVVMVNQQGDGGQWNLLGTFSFNAGNTTVSLSDQANGVVIADAVRFVAASAAPSSAQWTVPTAGQYQLYARWSAYPNRATNAPYTIVHAGGTTQLSLNQQQNGGQWNLLGTYTFTAGQTVTLTSQANGHVIADAIRLVPATAQAQTMYFIHTDHLNTPRTITNGASQVVWRWDHTEPFGSDPANGNPTGLGAFEFNLRLPGQYFDKETNLHYNYFRDYDPAIGRYVQSDPLSLAGGINTYLFVDANPTSNFDTFGLQAKRRGWGTPLFGSRVQPRDPHGYDVLFPEAGRKPGWRWSTMFPGLKSESSEGSGEEKCGAQNLPDLGGKSEEEAEKALEDAGFRQGQGGGSYDVWVHPDGSVVHVAPDGRVIRQGPKRPRKDGQPGLVQDRFGPDGRQVPYQPGAGTHDTGERIVR